MPCPQRSSPAAPLQFTVQSQAHQPAQPGQSRPVPAQQQQQHQQQQQQQQQHQQQQADPAFSHQSACSQRSPAEQARHSGAAASGGQDNQRGLSVHGRVMHSSQPLRRVSSQGNPAPMFRHPAASQQQQKSVSQQAAAAFDAPWVRPETLRQRRRSRSQGDLPLLALPLIPVQPPDGSRSATARQALQPVDADLAPQFNSFPDQPPAVAAQQQERQHSPGTSPAALPASRTAAGALLPQPQQQQHVAVNSTAAVVPCHQEAQHHPATTLSHVAARPLDSQRYACCRAWFHARGRCHSLTAITDVSLWLCMLIADCSDL